MNLTKSLLAAVGLLTALPAFAEGPAQDALQEFRNGKRRPGAIQNRFFLKQNRFEITPFFGYVPNNPFVVRYNGGVSVAYHFNEQFAAEGTISYSPDLGVRDVKGLTSTLVQIAQTGTGSGADFQQPLDKVTLGASFAARWAPLYGKINLIGESVLNFDFYGTAGLGIASKINYYAVANPDFGRVDGAHPTMLEPQGQEVKLTPIIGAGTNLFLTQSVAIKLDARSELYIDDMPDYQPNEPNELDGVQRLYSHLVTSVGVAIYFPKMKPRIENF